MDKGALLFCVNQNSGPSRRFPDRLASPFRPTRSQAQENMDPRLRRPLLVLVVLLLLALPSPSEAQSGIGDLIGLFNPWPFQCQGPISLGQACIEDYDCDASQGHHCHLSKRVCAPGRPAGAPCISGIGTWCSVCGRSGAALRPPSNANAQSPHQGCASGLGCKLLPPPMECFPVQCIPQPDGSDSCTQGRSLGIPCAFENATLACPAGSQCNMASADPTVGSGVCAPLGTTEGEDCSLYVGQPLCGPGLMCLMGRGVCGFGGESGEPCPIAPDRCDVTQGLACISQTVEPFASTCLPARTLGEHCTSGGEW